MLWLSPKRRLPIVIGLLVLLIVVGSIVAHSRGPAPDAGDRYSATVVVQSRSGTVLRRLDMSFAVSTDDHRVSSLHFPGGVPSRCAAGRVRGVRVAAGSASIVSPSLFRLRLALLGRGRVGTLLVSGAFHTFGRASGAVSTTFTTAALKRCGTGAGYTAKAQS